MGVRKYSKYIYIAALSGFSILLIHLGLSYYLSQVRFTGERIIIQVYPQKVVVQGDYEFQNVAGFPVTRALRYPFPIDGEHAFPSQVSARQVVPHVETVKLSPGRDSVRFRLRFRPGEKKRIHIEYAQASENRRAKYILTTTQKWKRPLERAVFQIIGNQVTIKKSNYELKPEGQGQSGFERRHFMPDRDWEFTWDTNKN